MSQDSRIQVITKSSIPLWRDERVIQGIAQVISAVLVIGFLIFFVSNVFQAANGTRTEPGIRLCRRVGRFSPGRVGDPIR